MHTDDCSSDCETCTLDKASFAEVEGTPALNLDTIRAGLVTFCQASNLMMVISHGFTPKDYDHRNGRTINDC